MLQQTELNETTKKYVTKKRAITAVVTVLVTAMVVTGIIVGIWIFSEQNKMTLQVYYIRKQYLIIFIYSLFYYEQAINNNYMRHYNYTY